MNHRLDIICKITPAALQLLQSLKDKVPGIGCEQIGHANGTGNATPLRNDHFADRVRSTNGVKHIPYSKGAMRMAKSTVLALGGLSPTYQGHPLGDIYVAIANKMQSGPEHNNIPTMTHARAMEIIAPLCKGKASTYAAGRIGDLYRLGALRVLA